MKRKIKNTIIKTITTVASILFLLFASALDAGGYIPFVGCIVCLAWIILFMVANKDLKIRY